MFRHTSVINSQKLVGSSGHIDVEMLAFKAFLVHKLKYCVVHRGFRITDITWNKVLRSEAEPRLEIERDCALKLPDWKGGASKPAKATKARLLWKRETSPISAINWDPRTEPTPNILITTLYSGSELARRFISEARLARVSAMQLSCEIALAISKVVLSSKGKDGEQLQAKSWISCALYYIGTFCGHLSILRDFFVKKGESYGRELRR